MNTPVMRAIWLIESHLETDPQLELGRIADHAGVSRHHLVRAFGASTGHSVMRYVRNRRLSKAAIELCKEGETHRDILGFALGAGYNSHEAFTRAFRNYFGITPDQLRARKCIELLKLQEPITISDDLIVDLAPARIEDHDALTIAGLGERYTFEKNHAIPALWQRFIPHIDHIHGRIGGNTYGVCYNGNGEGNFDYICGVAVSSISDLPGDFKTVKLYSGKYAVFRHVGHISGIRATRNTIWNKWFPESGYEAAAAPDFECYSANFNPTTNCGHVDILIPLATD